MTVDNSADRTFRLIYRSHSLLPEQSRRTELGELFTQARSSNKAQGITGALLLSGDWFVQTLEGDELRVRSLFEHIEQDPRHDAVAVVEQGAVEERAFPRWAMAEIGADGAPDTYLIAHADGIAPAAARGSTLVQESVLGAMRSAARSAAHSN